MGGRKFLVLLLTLTAVLGMLPAQAAADFYEGYCKDGKPVVTKWPPEYADFIPECDGDWLVATRKPEIVEWYYPKTPEEPDDFGRWAWIYLNGLEIINPYADVRSFVVRSTGRTLVPIRMVTEAMGGTAEWDEAIRSVTILLGDRSMRMSIGSAEAIANGEPVTLDQPPLIWKDRTMVPLRVVVEAFGAQVDWLDPDSRIDIALSGVTCDPKYCPRL